MKVKVVYSVDNYTKFVKGELIEEDKNFVFIKARDGAEIQINRQNILEFIKYKSEGGGNEGKTEKE